MQKSSEYHKPGPSHDGDKPYGPLKPMVYLSSEDEEDFMHDLKNLTTEVKDWKLNEKTTTIQRKTQTSEDSDYWGDDEDNDNKQLYPSGLTTVGPVLTPSKNLFMPDTKAKSGWRSGAQTAIVVQFNIPK